MQRKKKKKKWPRSGKIKTSTLRFWRLLDWKKIYLGQSNKGKLLIKFDFLSILSRRMWFILSTEHPTGALADLNHKTVVPPNVRESKTVLDSGFHAEEFVFQVLDSSLCQWNLDSGFQSLVGFRIP